MNIERNIPQPQSALEERYFDVVGHPLTTCLVDTAMGVKTLNLSNPPSVGDMRIRRSKIRRVLTAQPHQWHERPMRQGWGHVLELLTYEILSDSAQRTNELYNTHFSVHSTPFNLERYVTEKGRKYSLPGFDLAITDNTMLVGGIDMKLGERPQSHSFSLFPFRGHPIPRVQLNFGDYITMNEEFPDPIIAQLVTYVRAVNSNVPFDELGHMVDIKGIGDYMISALHRKVNAYMQSLTDESSVRHYTPVHSEDYPVLRRNLQAFNRFLTLCPL